MQIDIDSVKLLMIEVDVKKDDEKASSLVLTIVE